MNARQAKKNVKNAAPAVEKAVAETVKKEVKAEAPKKEAVKAEAPKKEAVKTEAPKKEAVKTEAPKAETKRGRKPKTEAEKAATTAAKKATTKTSSTQVVIQCLGNEATIDSIVEKITNIFVSEGHRASSIKDLRVYLKPEEGLAYYVINEKNAGSVSLF